MRVGASHVVAQHGIRPPAPRPHLRIDMKKWIAGPALAGLMVFGTATAVEATTPPADPVTTDSGSDDEDSDKTGLWGLLGLAGLAGLGRAQAARRLHPRPARHHHHWWFVGPLTDQIASQALPPSRSGLARSSHRPLTTAAPPSAFTPARCHEPGRRSRCWSSPRPTVLTTVRAGQPGRRS